MLVAVDLDDVLADLISCLIRTHEEIVGEQLERSQATSWDVFPPAVHDHVRYEGGYGTLLPLPYAREFLGWLRERHTVHIVTYRGAHAQQVTENWLAQHVDGRFDGLHLTGGGKGDACRELGADLIVDDSYNQIPAVTDALQIPGILIDTPMNQHIQESALVRRARGLRQARRVIEDLQREDRLA